MFFRLKGLTINVKWILIDGSGKEYGTFNGFLVGKENTKSFNDSFFDKEDVQYRSLVFRYDQMIPISEKKPEDWL